MALIFFKKPFNTAMEHFIIWGCMFYPTYYNFYRDARLLEMFGAEGSERRGIVRAPVVCI